MTADQYDGFAERYEAENASSLLNAYYERPAMLRLAGDVQGRRILDAGCGSGPLAEELRARGALMTGLDGSPAMIELARRRLGDEVPLHVADLGQPLPFGDESFDDVVASLVLHYLEDWEGPLAEIRRVLKPGGRLIASVNHPTVRLFTFPDEDYFATRQYSEELDLAGESTTLTFWHRPLRAMTEPFSSAGFCISVIDEPPPSSETPVELLPPRIVNGERTAFLCFLFFVLIAE
ncbi:class I SAM-dependent DNA methyltransferase [Citricoccus sp. GCM10030269]|uniref:class I SAM-dependent DNA methyltransferase n=1 Tax=Citricoccus sp. GCM10030269 TaxID=3273388 RepID=UPI00362047BE